MKGNRVAIGVRNARWGGFKITFLKVQTNMNHVKWWLKLKRTATNILWTLIKKLTFWKQLEELHAGDVSVISTGQSLINLPCCKIKHCRQTFRFCREQPKLKRGCAALWSSEGTYAVYSYLLTPIGQESAQPHAFQCHPPHRNRFSQGQPTPVFFALRSRLSLPQWGRLWERG